MARRHSKYSLYNDDMKNSTIPAVKKVMPQQDYCLDVVFSNGERGMLNMRPYLDFGVFGRLRDVAAFRQVKVSFDTVQWESDADLDLNLFIKKPGAPEPGRTGLPGAPRNDIRPGPRIRVIESAPS